MLEGIFKLVADMGVKRAAEGNIEHLKAATDGEKWFFVGNDLPGEVDLKGVAIGFDRMHADGFAGGAMTGLAVKSKGMPRTSAYSTLKSPSSFNS